MTEEEAIELMSDVAENIKKYRELRSLSLPDLATRAGVSKAFLWEIETGNSKRPGAETLWKIAEALNVTIAHLMGKEPTSESATSIQPEINDGLRAFVNERKRQGQPLDPEEIESLAVVQLKGGRPSTKQQWSLVYGILKETTAGSDA